MSASAPPTDRLELLEGYLRQDPSNPGLLAEAAAAAIEAGKLARAEELLGRLQQGSNPKVEHLRGLLHLARHRFAEAAASFERVTSQGQGTAAVRFNLAYAWFGMGEFSRASAALRELLHEADAPPQTLAYLMRSLHHAGQPAEALAAWRAAGERFKTPQTLGVASLASLDADDPGEAARLSEMALQAPSPPLEALVVRGTLAVGEGRLDLAEPLLDEAAARSPEDGRVWSAMAAARMLKGDVPGALDAFRKATRLLPQHVGSWVSQAWCEILQRDLDGAQATLRTALQLDRNFSEAHGTLAVVAALQGQAEQAEREIEVALRLDASSVSARYAQSVLRGEASDPRAVQTLARRLLRSRAELPLAKLLDEPAERA